MKGLPAFRLPPTLLCPDFSAHLPCCALIFLRTYYPAVLLIFFALTLRSCRVIFRLLYCALIFFLRIYPAVPLVYSAFRLPLTEYPAVPGIFFRTPAVPLSRFSIKEYQLPRTLLCPDFLF